MLYLKCKHNNYSKTKMHVKCANCESHRCMAINVEYFFLYFASYVSEVRTFYV